MKLLLCVLIVVAMSMMSMTTHAAETAPRIVDLNEATLEELCTLPGVGPKRAQAILDRRARRPFTRVTQLLEVRGIGKKSLEKLKTRVRVVPPAAPVLTSPG